MKSCLDAVLAPEDEYFTFAYIDYLSHGVVNYELLCKVTLPTSNQSLVQSLQHDRRSPAWVVLLFIVNARHVAKG